MGKRRCEDLLKQGCHGWGPSHEAHLDDDSRCELCSEVMPALQLSLTQEKPLLFSRDAQTCGHRRLQRLHCLLAKADASQLATER